MKSAAAGPRRTADSYRRRLERFPAKWELVRRQKVRQIKRLERSSDSIGAALQIVAQARASGCEILRELPPRRRRQHGQVAVGFVVAAHEDVGRRVVEAGDLGWIEREADEVDRGGLAVLAGALDVALGLAGAAILPHLEKEVALHVAQAAQRRVAAHRVLELEHDGSHQLAPLLA